MAPREKKQETHPSGRVCGYPRCRTVLSIYNEDQFCSLHPQPSIHEMALRARRGTDSIPKRISPPNEVKFTKHDGKAVALTIVNRLRDHT